MGKEKRSVPLHSGCGSAEASVIARDLHTATRTVGERVGWGIRGRTVNADDDPGEETLGDIVPEVDVVKDGVRGRVGSLLLAEDVVIDVEGHFGRIGGVRGGSLDLVDQVLVPEELADVRDVATGQRPVGKHRGVLVESHVQVGGAAFVVAREDGRELGHTFVVGRLNPTQRRVVQVGQVVVVALVHLAVHARVGARRVGVPDVEPPVRNGLARVHVDELRLHNIHDARLILADVGPDELARHVEGAHLALRAQHGAAGGAEDVVRVGESLSDVHARGEVVVLVGDTGGVPLHNIALAVFG